MSHIDRRSYKGYLALAEAGHLDTTLNSLKLTEWARQFADIKALELAGDARKVERKTVTSERKALAARRFLEFLGRYRKDYFRRTGKPYPESAGSVRALNRQFLRRNGLKLEVEAWLNAPWRNEPIRAGLALALTDAQHHPK